MADLTSLYHNEPIRDIAIQTCIGVIEKFCLEFPEYSMRGSFTNYFDIQGGTQPPKSQFIHSLDKGYVRFLQIRDFSSDNTPTYIPDSNRNKECVETDVLLGRYGASVGKILTGKTGAYNVACAKVIIKSSQIEKKYLFYLLHSNRVQNVLKNISRSAQGGFNKGDLSAIELIIPNKQYQLSLCKILSIVERYLLRESDKLAFPHYDEFLNAICTDINHKISSILEVEDLIKAQDNINLNIQLLRQTILQEAVQGKLVPQNPDDEPATELLRKIQAEKEQLIKEKKIKKPKPLPPIADDEIPYDLPEGWVWCRLGEVTQSITNGLYKPSNYYDKSGVISLRMYNIQNGKIDFSDCKRVILADDERSTYLLEDFDILINRVNSAELVGKAAIIENPKEVLVYESMNMRLRLFKKELIAGYLNTYFSCRNYKDYIYKNCKQAISQASINQALLSNHVIPLPPQKEQRRILDKVEQLMLLCNSLEAQVQQSKTDAEQLLQAVLREAFEGKQEQLEPVAMAAEGEVEYKKK